MGPGIKVDTNRLRPEVGRTPDHRAVTTRGNAPVASLPHNQNRSLAKDRWSFRWVMGSPTSRGELVIGSSGTVPFAPRGVRCKASTPSRSERRCT